ncbi:hypothetical protein TNCV_2073251 [Trichonephila clavipes]|uniref:Uncharacterized protein n=1 Tax=Trichonephila clavipes TaxID=2585209 RepID=A0A8X6RJB0_TRICX|nr:hypothetical protein TNCV_2073251 [Trichonephila clavipes]
MYASSSSANPTPQAHADTPRDILPREGISHPSSFSIPTLCKSESCDDTTLYNLGYETSGFFKDVNYHVNIEHQLARDNGETTLSFLNARTFSYPSF